MRKFIVTTTINAPTPEIRKYDALRGWKLIVVGDRKTPEYKLKCGQFISWDEQQKKYPDLCSLIGPDSVARGRMIAFIEAFRQGADIVATIDDDNMPYENWGEEILVGKKVSVLCYDTNELCFDPLSVQNLSAQVWHRGYPLELVRKYTSMSLHERTITPLVQANLWDGDPDIDAVSRIALRPNLSMERKTFYSTNTFCPVNTQNTILHRKALKHFPANIPFIGRADDIWASYLFESEHPCSVVYGPATVMHRQERSMKSLLNDLENEMFLYRNNLAFLTTLRDKGRDAAMREHLPSKSIHAVELYQSYFK